MRWPSVAMLVLLCASMIFAGCETTRKSEARRRESMDQYSFSYAYPKGAMPSAQDKRTLRDLESEGWRPVSEDRVTEGDQIKITVYFER